MTVTNIRSIYKPKLLQRVKINNTLGLYETYAVLINIMMFK